MSISERYFALAIDEMKVRSGLVFQKYTGELVGFCNFGQVNEDLERLSESLCTDSVHATPKLADHVLQFMVRHILKPSTFFPVAMFPCTSLSGEKLYPMVYDVIEALELEGFTVVSITSDGNSPNRRFYRICHLSKERPNTQNIKPIWWLSWHLLFFVTLHICLKPQEKNCFANSYSHSRTRTLWVCETLCRCISIVHHTHYIIIFTLQKNGQDISWKHVENLYLTETNTIGGVRLCPKLTKEHLWLSSYSKMRVYLAAQVN